MNHTDKEKAELLDDATMSLYKVVRDHYLPDLPDPELYTKVIVGPEVVVTYSTNSLPSVDMMLKLVDMAEGRGIINDDS